MLKKRKLGKTASPATLVIKKTEASSPTEVDRLPDASEIGEPSSAASASTQAASTVSASA